MFNALLEVDQVDTYDDEGFQLYIDYEASEVTLRRKERSHIDVNNSTMVRDHDNPVATFMHSQSALQGQSLPLSSTFIHPVPGDNDRGNIFDPIQTLTQAQPNQISGLASNSTPRTEQSSDTEFQDALEDVNTSIEQVNVSGKKQTLITSFFQKK